MYDGSGDSTGMQSVFANVFQSLGGTVTTIEPIDAQGVDFSAPLTKIAATGAELLYVPIRLQALSVVMRQARTTPGLENAAIVGSAEAFSPKAQETLGDAIEGFLVTRPDLSAYSPDYFSVFIPKYEELFGGSPNGFFHAYAFDAANLIFAAIEKVAIQDSSGTLTIGRQALRDAMYATKDFQGLTGVLTCTPAGDCANPVVIVYQYHIGQYPPTRVWP
jgi:branched-chain amino acid transport system substrate-binding protein